MITKKLAYTVDGGYNTFNIKIKVFDNDCMPERHGDLCDLKASKDITIAKGSFALIPLGVAMKFDKGHYAMLFPRSSTFKKYKVIQTNGVGIIDNEYCGNEDEWMMPVYATEDTFIPKGARVAQFDIRSSTGTFIFEEVDTLDSTNRGGFGSTGV